MGTPCQVIARTVSQEEEHKMKTQLPKYSNFHWSSDFFFILTWPLMTIVAALNA
jgi:hypothetical protein